MNRKRVIFFLVFLLIITPGCWNRREPEELALVLMAAFDLDQESGDFKIIAQIANPLAMGGEGPEAGGGGGADSTWVVAASGQTPFEAARNLVTKSTREINFSHATVVLFSEDIAREGLHQLFDFLDRERQFRLVVHPMVVDGDIRKAMEAEYAMEEVGAVALVRHVRTTSQERAVTRNLFLRDVYNIFSQPGWDVTIPRLHIITGEEGELVEEAPVQLSGLAAFSKDRMVDWLNDKESRGLNWVLGDINRAVYVLKSPPDSSRPTTVEIYQTSSSMKAEIQGEEVKIILEIEADGRLQETHTERGWLSEESQLTESLDRRLAQAIRNDVRLVLEKAQNDLKADIFGFGNLIYRTQPKDWARLSDRWDEIFPQVQVEILVDANIRRTGLIKDPLIIR
jgi:spore germination protein KC